MKKELDLIYGEDVQNQDCVIIRKLAHGTESAIGSAIGARILLAVVTTVIGMVLLGTLMYEIRGYFAVGGEALLSLFIGAVVFLVSGKAVEDEGTR